MHPLIGQPKKQKQRKYLMALFKPGSTRGLTGTGPHLDCDETADRVFRLVWNLSKLFSCSKPWLPARYPDQLITLAFHSQTNNNPEGLEQSGSHTQMLQNDIGGNYIHQTKRNAITHEQTKKTSKLANFPLPQQSHLPGLSPHHSQTHWQQSQHLSLHPPHPHPTLPTLNCPSWARQRSRLCLACSLSILTFLPPFLLSSVLWLCCLTDELQQTCGHHVQCS